MNDMSSRRVSKSGGGGWYADPHDLTLAIEYPVRNLCIKIVNRFSHVLRWGIDFLCMKIRFTIGLRKTFAARSYRVLRECLDFPSIRLVYRYHYV